MTSKIEQDLKNDPNYSGKLAESGLWNPRLIAQISHVVSSGYIDIKQTLESEGFHVLSWVNSNMKDEVIVEIRDGVSKLLVNTDRYRTFRESLALEGIAARYGLKMGEYSDDD